MTAAEKYEKACNEYLRNAKAVGNSETTLKNYQRRLYMFGEFWKSRYLPAEPINDPSIEDVKAWRDSLLDSGVKATSCKQYLNELRYFFAAMSDPELEEERLYLKNPVTKRIIPKTSREDARPYDILLTEEQVIKLWQNNKSAMKRRNDMWVRNYAIVVLLLTSEIRNGELLALTPADLDWENSEITVEKGKGNKFRIVDFSEIAQSAIALYLMSGIRPEYAKDTDPLFGTSADENGRNTKEWHKGTTQWLSQLVERHVRNVTGVSGIRTHDLRHVGSRLDLNYGMSFAALQSKLGHSSVTTTQIYSGKLLARRQRRATAEVFAEREKQTEYNLNLIEWQLIKMSKNKRKETQNVISFPARDTSPADKEKDSAGYISEDAQMVWA